MEDSTSLVHQVRVSQGITSEAIWPRQVLSMIRRLSTRIPLSGPNPGAGVGLMPKAQSPQYRLLLHPPFGKN